MPDDRLDRRYSQSLKNLAQALTFVDHAFLFDNSLIDQPFRKIMTIRCRRLEQMDELPPHWLEDVLREANIKWRETRTTDEDTKT